MQELERQATALAHSEEAAAAAEQQHVAAEAELRQQLLQAQADLARQQVRWRLALCMQAAHLGSLVKCEHSNRPSRQMGVQLTCCTVQRHIMPRLSSMSVCRQRRLLQRWPGCLGIRKRCWLRSRQPTRSVTRSSSSWPGEHLGGVPQEWHVRVHLISLESI